MTGKKAIFLDKDGTLINDVPYNIDPDRITLIDDCTLGLKLLQQAGYLLVVITNQAGIAKGYFREEALAEVEKKLKTLLAVYDIKLDGFYYCPHHPAGKVQQYTKVCDCRKPEPGMLWLATKELAIDLEASWMIGDILNDVEAGNRAGCRTILIGNGNETEWLLNDSRIPDQVCQNINEAASYLISRTRHDSELASL